MSKGSRTNSTASPQKDTRLPNPSRDFLQRQKSARCTSLLNGRIQFSADKSLYGDWGINGIRRMVVNLVTNAIKYSTPDTRIIIKLQRRDDQAVLSVHNEGREIPVDDQEKLFQAFERTQETENSAIKGWGLGFASVKAIAKAHGGTVTFESDKIVGTTFTLKLPIRSHA